MRNKKVRRGSAAPETATLEARCRELEAQVAKLTKSAGRRGPSNNFVDEKWVAKRLGMTEKYLQKLRYAKAGPPYYKFGGAVRYRISEIRAFIEQCKQT